MNKVRLGDYADQIRGVSYKPQDLHATLNKNSMILLRANNINDDRLNFDNVVFVDRHKVNSNQYLREGDIVVCGSSGSKKLVGKAGQAAHFFSNVTFGAFCKVVRPKNIVARYLGHYFFSSQYRKTISELSEGANINNIRNSDINELMLPLPDEASQQRIAAVLDKAQALIAARREQITVLDKLVKSQFVEMFGDPVTNPMGWEVKRLNEISTTRLGKMLDAKQQTGEHSYPYLANFNVQWFRLNLEKLNRMDFDEADRIEFALQYGDLLVCEGGEVGRTAIWKNELPDCFFQKAIHRVRCNPDCCIPEYLGWVMFFKATMTQFDGIVTGVTIAHLTGEKLKSLKIQIPPLDLQTRFADFVRQADKSKFALKKSLAELEALYKSLAERAFSGKLFG